jgi:hypothetical protein
MVIFKRPLGKPASDQVGLREPALVLHELVTAQLSGFFCADWRAGAARVPRVMPERRRRLSGIVP